LIQVNVFVRIFRQKPVHVAGTGNVADEKSFLLAQAARFRRLARQVLDAKAEEALLSLAAEYEQRAAGPEAQPLGGEARALESSR
jgi:hypothetical protein